MSDFHLTPLTASELEEGQRFHPPPITVAMIDQSGTVWDNDHLWHDPQKTVYVESPCPAQRKWEALRDAVDGVIAGRCAPAFRDALRSVRDQMDAIDKEQGE